MNAEPTHTPTDSPQEETVAGDTLLNELRTLSASLDGYGEQVGAAEIPGLLKALIYRVETGGVEPPERNPVPAPGEPVNPATADPRDVRIRELEAEDRDDDQRIAELEADLAAARSTPAVGPGAPTSPAEAAPDSPPVPVPPAAAGGEAPPPSDPSSPAQPTPENPVPPQTANGGESA